MWRQETGTKFYLQGRRSSVISSTLFGAWNEEHFQTSRDWLGWSYLIRVVKHLHQVPLGSVGFGSSVSRSSPERLPRLEVSLLLLLLELPGPLVVVALLMNLRGWEGQGLKAISMSDL